MVSENKQAEGSEKGSVEVGIVKLMALLFSLPFVSTHISNIPFSSLILDLATLFYEWGWGQSFHFANQLRDENFKQSIRRHEYYLASRLDNLQTGASLLDCGCGVGGPMRYDSDL